jgi:uncharacterized protein (DUF2147 family)
MQNRIPASPQLRAALVAIAVALTSAGLADDGGSAVTKPSVLGLWKTVDDKTGEVRSIARLYEHEGLVNGRIERIFPGPNDDPDPVCDKCPGQKRNAKIVGLEFLWGFRADGDKWVDGKVLDPDNGKVYQATLSLLDNGARLKVYGFIRIIIRIGRGQVWLRASESDLE